MTGRETQFCEARDVRIGDLIEGIPVTAVRVDARGIVWISRDDGRSYVCAADKQFEVERR